MMELQQVKNIIEACLLVAGKAMTVRQLGELFEADENRPDKDVIKNCIEQLQADYEGRGIQLVHVASGYRLQSRTEMSEWVAKLFPEKPPRYSRALLETLVLVAYRQPITRGEIEEIRGVAVSTNIVKTLQEREWVKEVGIKDVPGKPALLGTTRQFLDYFNLKRLDDLPPLSKIKNLDEMDATLMEAAGIAPAPDANAANDDEVTSEQESSDVTEGEVTVSDAESKDDVSTGVASDVGTDVGIDVGTDVAQSVFTAMSDNNEQMDSEVSADLETHSESNKSVTFAGLVAEIPTLDEQATSESPDSDTAASETLPDESGAEEELLTKLTEFAEEHQLEVEARDELENHLETRDTQPSGDESVLEAESSSTDGGESLSEVQRLTADVDEQEFTEDTSEADTLGDAIDASSTSMEILSETFTGDSSGAGETLH